MSATQEPLGLRERGKRERAARITAAAAGLFAQRPFDEVSTRDIAREAEVAEGTLFRYAATKTELLVMAFNTRFAASLEAGLTAAATHAPGDTVGRLGALAAALLESGADRPDNAALYQRELLFTTQAGAVVEQGVQIALDWEAAFEAPFLDQVAAQARAAAPDAAPGSSPTDVALQAARLAGSAAWDAVQLTAARRARRLGEATADRSPAPIADAWASLTGQFQLLARGLRGIEAVTPTPLR